ERDWNDWHFDLGGRFERNENDATGDNPDTDQDVFSVSVGAIWNFRQGYSVGLSITRAERAPDIQELYSDGPHAATGTFEIGDSDLGKETANNFDLTFKKSDGRWTWSVNLFAALYSDYVFLQSVDENGGAGPDGIAD